MNRIGFLKRALFCLIGLIGVFSFFGFEISNISAEFNYEGYKKITGVYGPLKAPGFHNLPGGYTYSTGKYSINYSDELGTPANAQDDRIAIVDVLNSDGKITRYINTVETGGNEKAVLKESPEARRFIDVIRADAGITEDMLAEVDKLYRYERFKNDSKQILSTNLNKDYLTGLLDKQYNKGESLSPTEERALGAAGFVKGTDGLYTTNDGFKQHSRDKADQEKAALQNRTNSNGECYSGLPSFRLSIGNCIEQAMYVVLVIIGGIVGIFGSFFNFIIEVTVVNMKTTLDQLGVINAGWKAFRDLANIAFIFILLYLAISQILGLNEHGVKHTLSKLIIFAMLINFSLFFTKVIIDASNIITLGFYNKIVVVPDKSLGTKPAGLGEAFMGAFRVQGVFPEGEKTNAEVFAASENAGTIFLVGIIFFITTICFFMAAIWLFLGRFIIFIFLMITAPLAFAGMVLHATEHEVHHMWWNKLIGNAFVAPAFMMMTWFILSLVNSPEFKKSIGLLDGNTIKTQLDALMGGASVSAIAGTTGGSMSTIFNFAIVIAMMFAALIIAEHMGALGAHRALHSFQNGFNKYALGWGVNKPLNAVYRNWVGKQAYNYGEKKWAESLRLYSSGAKSIRGVPKFLSKNVADIIDTRLGKLDRFAPGKFAVGEHAGGHGGHDGAHGDEGSFRAEEKYEQKRRMEAAKYEIRGDPDKISDFYKNLILSKSMGEKIATQSDFEDQSASAQAEILAPMKYRVAADETNSAKIWNPQTKQFDSYTDTRVATDKKAIEELESRLSSEEKDSLRKAEEGSLAYHTYQMNKLMESQGKDSNGNYLLKQQLKTLREIDRDLDLARQQQNQPEITRHEARRANIVNDSQFKAGSEQLQNFYKKLSSDQRVNLKPEDFASSIFAELRQSNDFEQFQRKAKGNPEIMKALRNQLTERLGAFEAKLAAGTSNPSEIEDMKTLLNFLKGATRYYGNEDNIKRLQEKLGGNQSSSTPPPSVIVPATRYTPIRP